MYDLLKRNGTLKGDIGEIIFSNINRFTNRTAGVSSDWLDLLHVELPEKYKIFLKENWQTIDAFKFIINEGKVLNIIFYEIKTSIKRDKVHCITRSAAAFYAKCIRCGFIVKSVRVYIFGQWQCEITEQDYKQSDYTLWDGGKYKKKG